MLASKDRRPSLVRASTLCLGAAVLVLGLARLVIPDLVAGFGAITTRGLHVQRFDALLVWGCEAAALAIVGWLSVLTVLVVIDVVRGRARRRDGCPEWLRRIVVAACGVGVVALLASPAHAGDAGHAAAGGGVPDPALVNGLAFPDRPSDAALPRDRTGGAAVARPRAAASLIGRDVHTVRRGDTLWDIAAATLDPGAADAEIVAQWHQLFTDNASVLGPDPELIHPGTAIHLPHA